MTLERFRLQILALFTKSLDKYRLTVVLFSVLLWFFPRARAKFWQNTHKGKTPKELPNYESLYYFNNYPIS